MARVWSIIINGVVPAKFDPDVFDIAPGQPLKAQIDDLVSWNNQTNDPHRIEVGPFSTEEIAPFKSSKPGYAVKQEAVGPDGTITYICTKHRGESGVIQVVAS